MQAIKDWGALVTVVLAAIGGLLWIGEMRGDIKHLTGDVAALKAEVADLKKPESAKGELCLKLTDELSKAYSSGVGSTLQSEEVERQMQQMGCYGLAVQPTDEANRNIPSD